MLIQMKTNTQTRGFRGNQMHPGVNFRGYMLLYIPIQVQLVLRSKQRFYLNEAAFFSYGTS